MWRSENRYRSYNWPWTRSWWSAWYYTWSSRSVVIRSDWRSLRPWCRRSVSWSHIISRSVWSVWSVMPVIIWPRSRSRRLLWRLLRFCLRLLRLIVRLLLLRLLSLWLLGLRFYISRSRGGTSDTLGFFRSRFSHACRLLLLHCSRCLCRCFRHERHQCQPCQHHGHCCPD